MPVNFDELPLETLDVPAADELGRAAGGEAFFLISSLLDLTDLQCRYWCWWWCWFDMTVQQYILFLDYCHNFPLLTIRLSNQKTNPFTNLVGAEGWYIVYSEYIYMAPPVAW